jgi:hypothetical protein
LRSAADIGSAVGAVVNSRKMAKHFALEIRDGHLAWRRRNETIEAEARLDASTASMSSAPTSGRASRRRRGGSSFLA